MRAIVQPICLLFVCKSVDFGICYPFVFAFGFCLLFAFAFFVCFFFVLLRFVCKTKKNDSIDKISELYSVLMPYVKKIDVSLSTMNKSRFVPIKNHETNELILNEKNSLQLLKGTSLIINQVALQTGKLNKNGVLNCQSLSQLIENQIVNYDFEFSQIPFETDCNIVVISENNPLKQFKCVTSIKVLHCNSCIKEEDGENDNVNANGGVGNGDENENESKVETKEKSDKNDAKIDEKQLETWRNYLCMARMILDRFSLPQSVCELAQTDFVNLRKRRNDVTDEDLHYRLTLLRLLNASLLKQETDESVFKQMQKLEIQRDIRNQK